MCFILHFHKELLYSYLIRLRLWSLGGSIGPHSASWSCWFTQYICISTWTLEQQKCSHDVREEAGEETKGSSDFIKTVQSCCDRYSKATEQLISSSLGWDKCLWTVNLVSVHVQTQWMRENATLHPTFCSLCGLHPVVSFSFRGGEGSGCVWEVYHCLPVCLLACGS